MRQQQCSAVGETGCSDQIISRRPGKELDAAGSLARRVEKSSGGREKSSGRRVDRSARRANFSGRRVGKLQTPSKKLEEKGSRKGVRDISSVEI